MKNKKYLYNPWSIFKNLISHRDLIWQLSKSQIIGRYRGSVLGVCWSFTIPLFMILIYTFVFSYIFQARWGGEDGNRTDYSVFLFSGLLIYHFFSECVVNSPALIISNANYVKRVVFPLEILVLISTLSSLIHFFIGFSVLLLFNLIVNSHIHWTVIYLPLLLFPLILLTIGISWILASLGTYIRDIGQTVGVLMTAFLFLSPIFYPASVLPKEFRPYLFLNPLTFIIEQFRDIFIFGNNPAWERLSVYTLVSTVVAMIGFYWFQKTRKGFADVL